MQTLSETYTTVTNILGLALDCSTGTVDRRVHVTRDIDSPRQREGRSGQGRQSVPCDCYTPLNFCGSSARLNYQCTASRRSREGLGRPGGEKPCVYGRSTHQRHGSRRFNSCDRICCGHDMTVTSSGSSSYRKG